MGARLATLAVAAVFGLHGAVALGDDLAQTPSAVNAAFKKDQAGLKGKTVTVKGYYMGFARQDTQLNVGVYSNPVVSQDAVVCIFTTGAETTFERMNPKDEITVIGVVEREFFDQALLRDCKFAR